MEQIKNNALMIAQAQKQELAEMMAVLIPESNENIDLLARNSMFYLIKNKAQFTPNAIQIGEITIDKFEFVQKMYEATSKGLSLIDKDFTLVAYKGGQLVLVPDFRKEKQLAEEKGLKIEFVHGRAGDEFIEKGLLKYDFIIKPRKNTFEKIEQKTMPTKNGGSYTINEVQNSVLWYGVTATTKSGEKFSYVESTENILLRANPASAKFYKDPNAKDSMNEKFVLRQLLKRMPNFATFDFDKWENDKYEGVDVDEAEYEEVQGQQTQPTQPAPTPGEKAKPKLEEGSATWQKMTESIMAGRVHNIEQIATKYDISEVADKINEIFDFAKTNELKLGNE